MALWQLYTTAQERRRSRRQREPQLEPEVSAQVAYYVKHHGYHYEEHRVVTKDGFVLPLFRIRARDSDRVGRPVILQHGLFMSSGVFVTNERDSLAFYLADRGCVAEAGIEGKDKERKGHKK